MTEQQPTETKDTAEFDPYGSIFLPSDPNASVEIVEQEFAHRYAALLLGRGRFKNLSPDQQQKLYEEYCLVRAWWLGRNVVATTLGEVA